MARSRERSLDLAAILTFVAISFVTTVAAVIRFTALDNLSLRIDEGYTLLYLKQSWHDVLGLDGAYEAHPPLFYTLAKIADLFVSQEIAARSVSALFGVLTIPLLFLMTARLLDTRAAFAASLLLAVAPMHIEFARDGRSYSTVTFIVLLSYAALLEYLSEPRARWAALYAITLPIAVYLDYSAVYALGPQAALLVIGLIRYRKRSLLLVGSVAVAILAYAPWLPQITMTIDALSATNEISGREDYLGVSRQAIEGSIPYVLGIDGRGSSSGGYENAWNRWQEYQHVMLLVVLGVGFAGLVLMRRRPIAALVSILLMIGVPVTAILVSLVSPGYASRTIQMALVGWCVATGYVIARLWGMRHALGRVAAVALTALLIGLSGVTLPATLSSVGRYDWQAMADTINENHHPGKPIIAASTAGMLTDLLYLYGGDDLAQEQIITVTDGNRESWYIAERWLDRGPTKQEVKDGALAPMFPPDDPSVDVIWFASRLGRTSVHRALEKLDYHMVLELPLRGGILWLLARPGADLGEVVYNNGDFTLGTDRPDGWAVGGGPYRVETDPTGGRRLVLNAGIRYQALSQRVTNASAGIYALSIDATAKKPVQMTARLTCLDANGVQLEEGEQTTGFSTPGGQLTMLVGVICPDTTKTVSIVILRGGDGELAIDKTALTFSRPNR